MDVKLKLNLKNLKIDKAANITWTDANSLAAHEGITNETGTTPGYPWIDRTDVNLPAVMAEYVPYADKLNDTFEATVEQLAAELKQTLAGAPTDSPFDYQAIAQSQSLTYEK